MLFSWQKRVLAQQGIKADLDHATVLRMSEQLLYDHETVLLLAEDELHPQFLEDPQAIIEAEQYAEDQRNIDMLLYDDTGQEPSAAPSEDVQQPTEPNAVQPQPLAATHEAAAVTSLGLVQYSSSDDEQDIGNT